MRSWRKIFSFLLALSLLLQMAPVLPLAARAETTSESVSYITVNGWVVMSGKYMTSEGRQVLDSKPESGGYLYYEDGYLLMENFTCQASSYNTLVSEQALTIELVGENTLTGDYMYAIRHTTEEPLVIQGEGSLTANGRNGGISAYGDVTLNANITATASGTYDGAIACNGNLYINGGTICALNTKAVAVNVKNVYLNGGVLEATGVTRGISTLLLEVNGGDLTAVSTDTEADNSSQAVYVCNNTPGTYLKIKNGMQLQVSTEPDGSGAAAADYSVWSSYDYVRIRDMGVEVNGVKLSSGEYLSQGSDTPAKGTPSGSYAFYQDGTLTLNNFTAEGGIHGYGTINLILQGDNQLGGNMVLDTGLVVSGTGSLEVSVGSEEAAAQAGDTVTVESGKLVITNSVGLGCELDDLVVNNGDVTVNGGVQVYGMAIHGGSCRITSHSAHPAVEIIPIDETSSGSVSLYGGSLALSASQTSALAGYLYMTGGEFFAETGAADCRVVTDNLTKPNLDGYEYLYADQPGGELIPCYENELGQFSRIRIRPHVCAPVLVEEIKPTCGDSGKLAYYRCFCGKYYEDAAGTVIIPNIYEYGNLDALGHDTEGVEYTVTDTEHYKNCKRCGYTDYTTLGYHNFGQGLACADCGYERTGNISGTVKCLFSCSVTFEVWQGDVLLNQYQSYGDTVSYNLGNFKPGTYLLKIIALGHGAYEMQIDMDRLQVEHNVTLQPKTVTMAGTVSSYGDGTDPVTLSLYQNGNLIHSTTVTGNPAAYSFDDILTGVYQMEISKKDHEFVSFEITIVESSTNSDYVLSVLRGSITGTVGCEGSASGLASLRLYRDGELAGTDSTNPNSGVIAFMNFPVGSYVLQVSLNGYRTVEIPVNLTTSGVNLEIAMEALKADVSVTVYSSGSETQEIWLRVMMGEEEYRTHVTAGNEVTCVFEDLPLGEYRLIVSKAGHETANTLLTVTENGGSMTIPLRAITGTVKGTVTTADGAAVDATVEVLQGGEVVKTANSTGKYSIGGLLVGSYTLRISMEGYETVEKALEVTEGSTAIDVELKKVTSEDSSSVAGTVTGFLTDGEVKLELLKDGQVVYTTTVTGMKADFSLEGVENGTYTLRISKANHATREQTISIDDSPLELNIKICPKGDATGDGAVNLKDFQRLARHINKTKPLTDYALDCGDLTGDGKCNLKDFQRLARHINKTKPLF